MALSLETGCGDAAHIDTTGSTGGASTGPASAPEPTSSTGLAPWTGSD